jgi:hypothetical protein
VTPDVEATADGIKMRSIDSFTWTRAIPVPGVSQAAIISRDTVADNNLTIMDLCRGFAICCFETLLFASFYTSLDEVTGSGVASMQFGTNASRRLRSGVRNLQEDDVAGGSEFELDLSIAKAGNFQGNSAASSMSLMSMLSLLSLALLACSKF